MLITHDCLSTGQVFYTPLAGEYLQLALKLDLALSHGL